jgi:hypothetical protein
MAFPKLATLCVIEGAVQSRASRYRDQAAHFLKMAATEPVAKLRHRLVDLAHEYHQLAATLEASQEQKYQRAVEKG